MLNKEYKILIGVFFMLLIITPVYAQYTVTGGNGTPLLIGGDSQLQVYLIYGTENVEIRYTSDSSNHQWYRYKRRALEDSEAISSIQEGTSSVIRNIEEGYGYYVKEHEAIGSNRFVWIIDYSRYLLDIEEIRVSSEDLCEGFTLEGNAILPKILYYKPNGVETEIVRNFDIIYNTLQWSEEGKTYSIVPVTEKIEGNPIGKFINSRLLTDTDILLKGDYFARHFNVEKSLNTGNVNAAAIELHVDTTILSVDGANMFFGNNGEEGGNASGYSAPVEIRFNAYANEPVATYFRWNIINEATGRTLIDFNDKEVSFTFLEAGKYIAKIDVQDRSGMCFKSDSVVIEVGDSYLSVPNAFSPGTSPGVNDIFKVAYKSLVSFKGWIFNRWGVQLFHWTDPAQGWDGKKGGKYVTPGVYFYVIEAKGSDGRNYKKNGHINILRPKNVQDQIIE